MSPWALTPRRVASSTTGWPSTRVRIDEIGRSLGDHAGCLSVGQLLNEEPVDHRVFCGSNGVARREVPHRLALPREAAF